MSACWPPDVASTSAITLDHLASLSAPPPITRAAPRPTLYAAAPTTSVPPPPFSHSASSPPWSSNRTLHSRLCHLSASAPSCHTLATAAWNAYTHASLILPSPLEPPRLDASPASFRAKAATSPAWKSTAASTTGIPSAPALCETDEAASTSSSAGHSVPPASSALSSSSASAPPPRNKRDWVYVVKSGLAGGVAGCAAKTAIAPLDRVKILFQASNPEFAKYSGKWLGVFKAGRDIVRNPENGGIMALFQGHSATLMRIFPYAAIKYMTYDVLHATLMPTKETETSARLFTAGAASGVLSVFVTYPLELIRVRLAFETKRKRQSGSLKRIIAKIYHEGSTEAPFSSDVRKRAGRFLQQAPSVAGAAAAAAAAANPAMSPGSTSASGREIGSYAAGVFNSAAQPRSVAATAGVVSPSPPEAVAAPASAPGPATSAPAPRTQRLLASFPLLKFYRGFTVTVMGMVPYAGTSFLVFGRTKRLLQTAFPQDEATTRAGGSGGGAAEARLGVRGGRRAWWYPSKTAVDLSAGAIAGAISQTAAYPFEVIRRRQQVGGIIRPGSMLGMAETARFIWRTSGVRGFYVGLSIGFLKVVPMTSISFAVWLAMKRQMGI